MHQIPNDETLTRALEVLEELKIYLIGNAILNGATLFRGFKMCYEREPVMLEVVWLKDIETSMNDARIKYDG